MLQCSQGWCRYSKLLWYFQTLYQAAVQHVPGIYRAGAWYPLTSEYSSLNYQVFVAVCQLYCCLKDLLLHSDIEDLTELPHSKLHCCLVSWLSAALVMFGMSTVLLAGPQASCIQHCITCRTTGFVITALYYLQDHRLRNYSTMLVVYKATGPQALYLHWCCTSLRTAQIPLTSSAQVYVYAAASLFHLY